MILASWWDGQSAQDMLLALSGDLYRCVYCQRLYVEDGNGDNPWVHHGWADGDPKECGACQADVCRPSLAQVIDERRLGRVSPRRKRRLVLTGLARLMGATLLTEEAEAIADRGGLAGALNRLLDDRRLASDGGVVITPTPDSWLLREPGDPGLLNTIAAALAYCQLPGRVRTASLEQVMRCVVGNPFDAWAWDSRPCPECGDVWLAGNGVDLTCCSGHVFGGLRQRWLTWSDGIVGRLARAIYQSREWDRLPILADSLEEAGCSQAALLDHLRAPVRHTRGCWVLDHLRRNP